MAESKVIGVDIDGVPTWHVIGIGPSDYSTLCGLDGDDSVVGQNGTLQANRGQKIDCFQCEQIWRELTRLRLRQSNFNVRSNHV